MKNSMMVLILSCLTTSLFADTELHDRIEMAIVLSDVVRTKALVRCLDQELSKEEKKELLHRFSKSATEIVKSRSNLRILNSRDVYTSLGGGLFSLIMVKRLFDHTKKCIQQPSVSQRFVSTTVMMLTEGAATVWLLYITKKGWDCYHQRKTYDKALRIETWLKEQEDAL